MINKLEKFFCITPLLLALLCTSFVSGEQVIPPDVVHREEANDCIEKIRQKQARIKQEIAKIKEIIRRDHQKETHQDLPPKDRP